MPQMSPLNWTFLFLYFLFLMMAIFFKIYFINFPIFKSKSKKLNMMNTISWQW